MMDVEVKSLYHTVNITRYAESEEKIPRHIIIFYFQSYFLHIIIPLFPTKLASSREVSIITETITTGTKEK